MYWSNVVVDLGFTWKSVKVRGGFVRNMVPGVICRVGKYVLLGQAMRKNTVYSDLLMRFAGGGKNKNAKKGKKVVVTEEDKMAYMRDSQSATVLSLPGMWRIWKA